MLAWQHDGLFGDALADGTVQLQLQAPHVGLPGAQKRQGVVFIFLLHVYNVQVLFASL